MRHQRIAARLLLALLPAALVGCAAAPTPPATSSATAAPAYPPGATAAPAYPPGSDLAWRETPAVMPDQSDIFCFLPGRSDMVLSASLAGGTVAINLVTGEQRQISRHTVLPGPNLGSSCLVSPAGDTFFGWSRDDQTWRFSLADGEGQQIARRPTHMAYDDWSTIYSLDYASADVHGLPTLWASADLGDSWSQLSLPDGVQVQAVLVALRDSAQIYAAGLTMRDSGESCSGKTTPIVDVEVNLYHSADSGRTWEARGALTTYTSCADHPHGMILMFVPGADRGTLLASYDSGSPGSSNLTTHLLSIDEGRTFREVGIGNLGGNAMFGDTGETIVRHNTQREGPRRLERTTDGGVTWASLAGPPSYPRWSVASYHGGFMSATFADPRSLLLLDGGCWYSADGGATWREIGEASDCEIYIYMSPFAPLSILRIKDRRIARLDLSGLTQTVIPTTAN